ncbi:MAG TPA: hypothetical protein VF760_05000 [Xanthobacteraceae bacterium]
MSRLAPWLFVLALLLVAVGVARLVCRVRDAAEQPESPEPEPRSTDAEFAEIVSTSLADLERAWRDE